MKEKGRKKEMLWPNLKCISPTLVTKDFLKNIVSEWTQINWESLISLKKKQSKNRRGKQHLKPCKAKNIILCCFDYILSFPFFFFLVCMCFVFYCLEDDSLYSSVT